MKQLLVFSLLFILTCGHAQAESHNEKIGREMHEQILQEMPIVQNKKLTDYVDQVGRKLLEASHIEKPQFTFTVIDDETINAFALPGGYIYVHRGLINYLNSEAQLAAVMAHEIAHVTENHHSRQQRASTTNAVVAGVLGILSGSSDVAEASGLWGQTMVSGYGRDMELEADKVGAEYLAAAGYDPQAVIEVISLLKDNERLEKKRAAESGKKVQTYHGLFATHPRNDTRLRQAVDEAEKRKDIEGVTNIQAFRLATDGMVWGKNYGEVTVPANIFQDEHFGYRFNIPEGWIFEDKGSAVIGEPKATEEKPIPEALVGAHLELTVLARTTESPDVYIKKRMKIPLLKKSEAFNPNRLAGYTGVIPAGGDQPEKRLVVLYYSRYAFVFKGNLTGKDVKEKDNAYLQISSTFRPVSKRALQARESQTINYVKATPNTTFAALANYLKLGKYGEEELRIINGYYPTGEPTPGQWIKIIR